MQILDRLDVTFQEQRRSIEIYHGDLTRLQKDHDVDILVVSAFPNNYIPTQNSLIGALDAVGVSVSNLANDKAEDLRKNFSCWISKELRGQIPGIHFNRILCFEPFVTGEPAEVVGDIFQALIPYLEPAGRAVNIAMPLVSTGNAYVSVADMIEPLIDATIYYMKRGIPINKLMIVEKSEYKAAEIRGAFSIIKRRYTQHSKASKFKYDLFVSYSRKNTRQTDILIAELEKMQRGIRVFLDRNELSTGAAWQQGIFEAIDNSSKVLCVFSPQYLESKVCKEEYNIALFRHREAQEGVLIPLYLLSAELPTYMRMIQYLDCREADPGKMKDSCAKIIEKVSG
jgi:hypothetical protein